MRHVILIKTDNMHKLPSIKELKAAGFFLSSALCPGMNTKTTKDIQKADAGKENQGGVTKDATD